MNLSKSLGLMILLLLMIGGMWAEAYSDPYTLKKLEAERKQLDVVKRAYVTDPSEEITPSMTELLVKNNFSTRGVTPPPRRIPPIAAKYYGTLPPEAAATSAVDKHKFLRELPTPDPGEIMTFGTDQLVSWDDEYAQRQPSVATGDDGTVYVVWGEAYGSGNRIMFSKSTDEGSTWSEAVVVDDAGTNFYPRLAVYGTGRHARLHVTYCYLNTHIYDVYDTTGSYVGTDTTQESDIYYCRSNNAGDDWGMYQVIANRDINLIIMQWDYDESLPDIAVDDDNNVVITYHTQADEGHIMSLALMIIYIILYEGLPPFWVDYSWYKVCMTVSTNGGGTFSGQTNVENSWFLDRTRAAAGLSGNGTSAVLHVPYSCTGILSLGSSHVETKRITNPFFGHSIHDEIEIGDGYIVPGGCKCGPDGNPKMAFTDAFSYSDYDVLYAHSEDGGYSYSSAVYVDFTTADCYEPRIEVDLANNPMLVWTDRTYGHYDIMTCWSEDAGLTLRDDHIRVNSYTAGADQYWPGIGLFLPDSIKRMDVGWWDQRSDEGDIYYNFNKWWRTDLHIVLHDSLANPLGGTLTLTYMSYGVEINREITTGDYIIYHDPGTEITLDQMSSESDAEERWIWSESGDWSYLPTSPGTDTTIVYYDQYYTTFTAASGNPPACTEVIPTGIAITYEFFSLIELESTIHVHWADVRGEWTYPECYPPRYEDTRWYCPEPTGLVLSPLVEPVYYYQYQSTFLKPTSLNDECCEDEPVEFTLTHRYFADTNVGGTTPLTDWTDCGSYYEYENPHNISDVERWHIPESSDSSGVVLGLGPYEPEAYKQYRPTINLIGPHETNTVWTEQRYLDGTPRLQSGLYNVYRDWVDCGGDLEFSQFTTLGWVATTPRLFECVTSAFTGMVRYGNVVMVELENDFGYGFIISDTDTHSSPYLAGWVPGHSYEICAISPQVFDYTRYVWDSWSDGGDICHAVVPVSDTSFTAYFNREFKLEIISEHGTYWGDGWYAEGADANFGITTIDTSGDGIRYVFDGWTGSGTGSYTGTDSSQTVFMDNPIIEEAEWISEYYLALDYESCDIAPTMVGEGWYSTGAFAAIETDSILGGAAPEDSVRCVFSHWESDPPGAPVSSANHAHTTVMLDRPYTMIAVYQAQYKLYIAHNPDTISSPADPSVGEHWVTEGDTVMALVESPWGPNYCIGYDGTGSVSDGSADSIVFEMIMPTHITWNWGDMFELTISDTTDTDWILAMSGASPTAGVHSIIPGAEVTASVGSEFVYIAGFRLRCVGYRATGSISDGTGTSVTFTMDENTTIEWLFQPEYKLTVDDVMYSDPGTHPHLDSPDPGFGDHWYRAGTEVTATIDERVGDYVNVGYTGTGPVPPMGWGASVTFTMTYNATLTWRWEDIGATVQIEVISDHGVCVPPVGLNYFPMGVEISAFTDLYATDPSGDVRWNCTGWTGTGVVPSAGTSPYIPSIILPSSPGLAGTITWHWDTQYRVEIISEYGDEMFPTLGDHWYNEGTMINAWVDPIDTIVAPDSIMFCTGFEGTGDCLDHIDRTLSNFTFSVTSPAVIEWEWTGYRIPLYIYSDWGSPVPDDTTLWLPGSRVSCFVTSPHTDGLLDGERYLCTGWSATGSAPASGTETSVSFTIDDTTAITWLWDHQYRLTIDSWPDVHGSPGPPVGDHWYNEGTVVTGNVTVPDDTFYCVGFEGTGSAPLRSPYADFEFALDEPSSVTWLWYGEGSVAELRVRSPYGDPEPHGRTWWLLGSEVDATVDSSVLVGSTVYDCMGWSGGGSVPASGDSNRIVFNITENTTISWLFGEMFSFQVINDGDYGTPDPAVGTYYNAGGTYVTGEMDNHPYWTGTDTMYCVGFLGTGDLPGFDPHTDFEFVHTTHTTLDWQWSDEAFRFTVTSFYGSPYPHGTTYWIPGTGVEATVDSDVEITDGIRAHCVGWNGTGSTPATGSGNYCAFTIYENSTLNWEWDMQYRLTIENTDDWGSPVPGVGDWWYNDSALVEGEITENPSGPADTMYCIGYFGTGDLPEVSPQSDFSFNITQPCSLEWRWAGEGSVARLDVISVHDDPHPYGTTYWLLGSPVHATVDSMAPGRDSLSFFECIGFNLVHGTVDTSDSAFEVDWTINEDAVLTWNWIGQVLIVLDYAGSPVEPLLEGGGWYEVGDTVEIEAETPVSDAGVYYGFVFWNRSNDFDPIEDSLLSMTHVVANEACTLTANYAPAHYVILQKDPSRNDKGFIQVDHVRHDSTAYVTSWWGNGSYHDIYVPPRDSLTVVDTSGAAMVTERFNFDHWSDDGDTLHRVGPILADEVYTAYYGAQYMCAITKYPPHSTGEFQIDGTMYSGTPSVVVWWDPGSEHNIRVSESDGCGAPECDTTRYFFEQWRDSVETTYRTDTIDGPSVFTAEYNKRMRIRIEKSPEHLGGSITLDDTTVYESSYDFWVDAGEDHTISVSEYDIDTLPVAPDPDWVYQWLSWDHGGAIEQETGVLDGHADYLAYYDSEIAVMDFAITVLEVPDSNWDVDSIECAETRSMVTDEQFFIKNTGNTPLDFGLQVIDVTDRLWAPGYFSSSNVFVVRAQFNDNMFPPSPFSMSRDYIKDELSWSTEGAHGVFGPCGVNVVPDDDYPGTSSSDNLWMQFVAPVWSDEFEIPMKVTIELKAKYHMP